MSHRNLTKDPIESRRHAYEKLEKEGAAQEAIFEAFAVLQANGMDLGQKMTEALAARQAIKTARPKGE